RRSARFGASRACLWIPVRPRLHERFLASSGGRIFGKFRPNGRLGSDTAKRCGGELFPGGLAVSALTGLDLSGRLPIAGDSDPRSAWARRSDRSSPVSAETARPPGNNSPPH